MANQANVEPFLWFIPVDRFSVFHFTVPQYACLDLSGAGRPVPRFRPQKIVDPLLAAFKANCADSLMTDAELVWE